MPDFMRNQGLAQAHGQQHMQMPNQSQQFSQLSHANHALQQNHHSQNPTMQASVRTPMPQQQHNFGAGGLPSSLLARASNPALMQAMTGNPNDMARQLGLLGVARNQLPQNGPVAAMNIQPQVLQQALGGQPGLGRAPFQPGMFQGQGDPSRSLPPGNAPAFSLQTILTEFIKGPDGRPLPLESIKAKTAQLKMEVEGMRRQIGQMSQAPNADIIPLIRKHQQAMQIKEALLARLQQLLSTPLQPSMSQMGGDGDMPGPK